jgi:hypothetical protein
MAGGLTGMIAWIFIFPVDLVKNVYQKEASIRRADQEASSQSVRQCIRMIYQRQGIRGFYHGLWPTMWRAFPIHSINLVVYEYFLKLLSQ